MSTLVDTAAGAKPDSVPPVPEGGASTRVWGTRTSWFRTWGFPLALIVVCPPLTVILWMLTVHFGGSVGTFITEITTADFLALLPAPSLKAFAIFATWAAVQLVLLKVLPGSEHLGPPTPMGNRPKYKNNGVLAFFATHALWYVAAYPLHLFSPTIVYDNFGSITITLSIFALLFCGFLYWKGVYFPSSSDASRKGNLIWDYYWGVELHPTMFGTSLKQWFNCRISMMGWSIILFSFLAKQYETYGYVSNSMIVSVAIQVAYIFKFFVWETGYFNSLDIMHDRFGFYICWGVTAWLPVVYTLVGLYLVNHPIELSPLAAIAILALGIGSIWMNYAADAQRQRVRATNGETTVWGKKPEMMRAEYETGDGEKRSSLLLLSGYWGISRHFHYVPEILLSLAWTLPALFGHVIPYFYVLYLTILLVDRAGRDEVRCGQKYGTYWEQYCARVRYKIIPGVY
jgi:7-dehydrocholesterol reductase